MREICSSGSTRGRWNRSDPPRHRPTLRRDGESAKELRARVNRVILEDLEAKVLALRALHAELRDMDAGESFGDIVARGRPKSEML